MYIVQLYIYIKNPFGSGRKVSILNNITSDTSYINNPNNTSYIKYIQNMKQLFFYNCTINLTI